MVLTVLLGSLKCGNPADVINENVFAENVLRLKQTKKIARIKINFFDVFGDQKVCRKCNVGFLIESVAIGLMDE